MVREAPGLTVETGESARVLLTGYWVLRHLSGSVNTLRRQLARCKTNPQTVWDLESIDGLDLHSLRHHFNRFYPDLALRSFKDLNKNYVDRRRIRAIRIWRRLSELAERQRFRPCPKCRECGAELAGTESLWD